VTSVLGGVTFEFTEAQGPRFEADGGHMMESDSMEVVKAFIAAINRRDPHEISALMTADHTFVDSRGKTLTGREIMTAGWEQYFGMFPDYKIRVENILEDGAVVAVFGSASGTYNGKRGLVPQNRIEMPAAWKAVIDNRRIRLWQVYADWTEGTRIMNEDEESA
jgi:ketosteroid isomerase-like protein